MKKNLVSFFFFSICLTKPAVPLVVFYLLLNIAIIVYLLLS